MVKQLIQWSDGQTASVGERINQGGESEIFTVEGYNNLLYKRYTKPRGETVDKIQKLITDRYYEIDGVMAPITMVSEGGVFSGFLMNAYPQHYELGATLFSPIHFLESFPSWTRIELIELALSYLSLVSQLHQKGALLGDINPHNVLFRSYNDVAVVDIDSVQIGDYLCPMGMEEYASPRLQGAKFSETRRTIEDELFAVAVLLFQIFTLGKHPYASIGVESLSEAIKMQHFVYPIGDEDNSLVPKGNWEYVWYELPFEIQRNFKTVFRYGQRVSVARWIEDLRSYQQQIRRGEFSREIRPQGYDKSADGVTVSFNRRDITDKDSLLRIPLTRLNNTGQKRIGILELSTKAVKLLVANASDEAIKTQPFDHQNFIREAFKTDTGRGLDAKNRMDMSYFAKSVAPWIHKCVEMARGFGVTHLYTAATAAYRGAENREEIAQYLQQNIGLNLNVLTKEEEALSTILAYQQSTRYRSELFAADWVLVIDQGGGSTEISLFQGANRDKAEPYSINLGTTVLRNILVRENREGALLSGAFKQSDKLIRERLKPLDNNIASLKGGLTGRVYCIAVGTAITSATRKKGNRNQHEYLFTLQKLEEVVQHAEEALLNQFKYVAEVLAATNRKDHTGRHNGYDADTLLTIRLGIPMFIGIMRKYGVEQLRVSGTGLWYGQYYTRLYEQ